MPGSCRPCGLYRTSISFRVSGEGNRDATIVCLGEALGEQEDEQGRPFVGRAGALLNGALYEVGLHRDEIWVTNSARCFTNNRVKIYTSEGFRAISQIKLGDLVLTHRGRFRRVDFLPSLKVLPKESTLIRLRVRQNWGSHTVVVTPEHPFYAGDRWVPASQLRAGDFLRVLGKHCKVCGSVYAPSASAYETQEVCSKACSMRLTYMNGRRDGARVAEQAHARTRDLVKLGNHNLQHLTVESKRRRRIASSKAISEGKGNGAQYLVGFGEPELATCLKKRKVSYRAQFAFPGSTYLYDFALPNEKLLLEVHGPGFNNTKARQRAEEKREFAESQGYSVIDVQYQLCRNKVQLQALLDRILANHRGEYVFVDARVVEATAYHSTRDLPLYNIGVEGDESYVVGGIVSHNCRPLNHAGKNRAPTVAELGHCRGWLDDEISSLPNVKVIVALGASAAWAALAPHAPTGGVLENQGRSFWSERYRCWVVCTLHPAYILRKPAERMWLVMDLVKAKRIAEHGQPLEPEQPEYRVVRTFEEACEARDDILQSSFIMFDWETDSLHPVTVRGQCAAFCTDCRPRFAWVIPRYGQNFMPWYASPSELRRVDAEVFRPIWLSQIPKGGQHVTFDCNVTESVHGVRPANVTYCTMIAHHLTNNHYPERAHGLKRMSDVYTPFGRYDDELDAWLIENGYTKDGKPDGAYIYKAPDAIRHKYVACDVIVPMLLRPIFDQQIAEAGLTEVFEQERMPFALSYGVRDRYGVRIDLPRLDRLGQDLALGMEAMLARLAQVTGVPDFNPNSHHQVARYLFGLTRWQIQEKLTKLRGLKRRTPEIETEITDLQSLLAQAPDDDGYIGGRLPVMGKTETGLPSTREDVLKQFEDDEPAVSLVLHFKNFSKKKGAFVDGNPHQVGGIRAAVDPDGRARPSTLLTAVETFRCATRKPFPIHTIPRPVALWSCSAGHGHYLFERCCAGAKRVTLSIRSLIVPDEGHLFVESDFRQQELAIGAIISGQSDWEAAMLDRQEDAHDYVMWLLFHRRKQEFGAADPGAEDGFRFFNKQAEVDYKNLRSDTKQTNFMIFYRGGERKLARRLSAPGERRAGRPPRVVLEHEAAQIIADYYDRLPQVHWWQYQTIKLLRKTGMSVSPFGTRRKLPGIFSPDKFDQYEAERQACNFPIQCSGYHVMARAVLRVEARWAGNPPLRAPFPGRVMFTIHDELVAQVRHDLVGEGAAMLREEMERPHPELVGGCGIPRGILIDQTITEAWGGLDKEDQRLGGALPAYTNGDG